MTEGGGEERDAVRVGLLVRVCACGCGLIFLCLWEARTVTMHGGLSREIGESKDGECDKDDEKIFTMASRQSWARREMRLTVDERSWQSRGCGGRDSLGKGSRARGPAALCH